MDDGRMRFLHEVVRRKRLIAGLTGFTSQASGTTQDTHPCHDDPKAVSSYT
jgi:hypothetical protein